MKPLFIDTGITEKKLFHIKRVDTPYLDKPFHFHPNCELVIIEEGFGKRVIGDDVANFHEEDVVLMGPNLPHIWINDTVFYSGNTNLRAKAVVIYFSPHLLDTLLETSELTSIQQLIQKAERGMAIYGKTREKIRQQVLTLCKKNGLGQLIGFLDVLNMLIQAKEKKYLSGKRIVNTYNEKDASRINTVYHFLLKNFKNDIQLEEVAGIAHMAPTAFCRFFKQRTNKTFSRFINELRIGHACDLLTNPEKTITEIAYESGYHNLTNFSKFFKAITGVTPSRYRKKATNTI
jgi:AraC-like DNA-binding protein